MERRKVVVIGSSFAGYTAAIHLKERLGIWHDVIVVSRTPDFVFVPSLIWYPFGIRDEKDITFDVRPQFAEREIGFIEGEVTGFDLGNRIVYLGEGRLRYDNLLIATGPKADYGAVPGLGPGRNSHSICSLDDAREAKEAWEEFLNDPGPLVVGAVQGASFFHAAYEFAFNAHRQLARHKLLGTSSITFLTAEPFLANLGIGGIGSGERICEMMFSHYDIAWRTNAVVDEVLSDRVVLRSGDEFRSKYTMLIPPFVGVDAVRDTPGLANERGFIEVDEYYRHREYPEVFAAGVAVEVAPAGSTPVECGVPKTGYPTTQMAKTAAHNIAVGIMGGDTEKLPFNDIAARCILDTGNMGMMIFGDHLLKPRAHEWVIPGPQAHWAKLAFEKHFMSSRSKGNV